MHLRVAQLGAPRRLISIRYRSASATTIVPLLLCALTFLSSVACGRQSASDVVVEWSLTPMPPSVGPAVLTVRLLDGDGRPLRGATIRVEGHMSHPGMAPVVASATECRDGEYEARLEFTMRGDWILLVEGSLAGGGAVHHRIDVPGVRAAG